MEKTQRTARGHRRRATPPPQPEPKPRNAFEEAGMKLQRRFGIEFYEMDAAAFNRMGRQARQERDREQGHDDGRGTAV